MDDCVQNTLLGLLERERCDSTVEDWRRYARAVARNACHAIIRNACRTRFDTCDIDAIPTPEDDGPAVRASLLEILRETAPDLTPRDRAVLTQLLAQRRMTDVCTAVGLAPTQVRRCIGRIGLAVRHRLSARGCAPENLFRS